MKLSYNWLSDYLDLSGLSVHEVADRLTMGAFEVEEVRRVGPDICGPVVVGEIVAIDPHPNADKIRLTRVLIAPGGEALEIVCGASNIIVGQHVPVALPGARVLNRHDGSPLNITRSKIRGVVSNGMLCSPPELGITGGESEGILVFAGRPALGADVIDMLDLRPDWVLHVEPRSNRGDALSVLGLAREVAALTGRPLRELEWRLDREDFTSPTVAVEIEDASDCPFFSIRVLEGLTVGPSPPWIIRRLESIGVRPVNNLVDITNYVLHELGQPLHAYDMSKIRGGRLSVRRARAMEKLVTIDGRERALSEEILVIADSESVLGVAGVMGGKDSEVSDDTTFVALEAAAFAPARVRRASRLTGLSSDSSIRFERGVDVASVRHASDRAAYLMIQAAGGHLGKLTAAGSDTCSPLTVNLRLGQVKRLLDIDVDEKEVSELLAPLGFQTAALSGGTVAVSVPSFRRRDVSREIDLVEEVCRLYGYDRIPVSMPRSTSAPQPPDSLPDEIRQALTASGLSETWGSSLTGKDPLDLGAVDEDLVEVLNPLSDEHQVLRKSLLTGLVRACLYNQDRGQMDVWLFEVGRVYRACGTADSKNPGCLEELKVAAIVSGQPDRGSWAAEKHPGQAGADLKAFYAAKGAIENLIERLRIDPLNVRFDSTCALPPLFHPGRSCQLVAAGAGGTLEIGQLGQLHPAVADRAGLKSAPSLFELSIDALRRLACPAKFRDINTHPPVTRDLTVDLGRGVEHARVESAIRKSGGDYLLRLDLASLYDLSPSEKSLCYRLTFQHPDKTLSADEIEPIIDAIRQNLAAALDARFRTEKSAGGTPSGQIN